MNWKNLLRWMGLMIVTAVAAWAADPADMDGVVGMGTSHLNAAKATAVGFAVLGMGWAGYRVVRKFVK